jgi:hypothetical protein
MFIARDSFLYSLSYELNKMRRILIPCTPSGANDHSLAFRWSATTGHCLPALRAALAQMVGPFAQFKNVKSRSGDVVTGY